MAAAWPKGRRFELHTDVRIHRRLQPLPRAEGAEPNCLSWPECQSSVELAHQCQTNATSKNQRVCLPTKLDRSARETLGWSAQGRACQAARQGPFIQTTNIVRIQTVEIARSGPPIDCQYTTSPEIGANAWFLRVQA